jgi:hypothetical protein
LAVLPGAWAGGSTTLWSGDFETGNLSQYWGGVQAKEPSRASIVTSPVRQGRYAVRLQVLPGDTNVASSGDNGERADLLITDEETGAFEGQEAWYAWSTYFPDDYHPAPNSAWNIFLDFHNDGGGQANFNFEVNTKPTPPVLELRAYGGQQDQNEELTTLAPLRLDHWYDFVLHVGWSASADRGFDELYLNGKRVIPRHARPTLYAGQNAYLKVANYRYESSLPSAIVEDGVRRVVSYRSAVAGFPKGTWPPVPPGIAASAPPAAHNAVSAGRPGR